MKRKSIPARIKGYCDRFPSEASRATLRSELVQANAYRPLNKWTSKIAHKRMRELEGVLKTRSIILKFQRLHRYFEWEKDQGYRRTNPVELTTLPKLRDIRAPQALTSKQVTQLYKVIPRNNWIGLRDRLAMSLMLVHGYRISTIVNMDWDHIDERSDGVYLATWAKNGVLETRKLRPDVAQLVNKYKAKTLAARC